ncbi:hypothetical protein C0989_009760 [Termitomyces sp. Mn162]|nr:hypothetical protein C0989_009760 [Termitomyces sp. Mn162]
MVARAIDTLPHHWRYVSEGGATIVFSYIGPPDAQFNGTVLRLRKAVLPTTDSHTPSNSLGTQDEPDDPMIEFQQKCVERLIPIEHLPRLESVYVSCEWLESLISLHDAKRPKDRRVKDQIDVTRRKGVLATDLVGGDWVSVEIKPKWGFLPSPIHLSDATRDVKSRTCRFCMHSAMRSKIGEAASLRYCPLDLFSEDKSRIKKAICDLWDTWTESNGTVNNLKIFVHGEKIVPSVASLMLSSGRDPKISDRDLREIFVEALMPILLQTPVLRILSTLQRSLDPLDIEGLSRLWHLTQQELNGIDTAYFPSLPIGSSSTHLMSTEPDMTDWTHFLDTYLSSYADFNHANPAPAHLRFYLLAYLLSATFKDCSIIVRFDRLRPTVPAEQVKPEQIMVIDLDPKDMVRLQKWEKLDQEITEAYGSGGDRKVCVDARWPYQRTKSKDEAD